MRLNKETYIKSQEEINNLFVEQVRNGRQSITLGPGVFSCGQFLGYLDSNQKGLHGTAAALRVLSAFPQINQDLINGLISYVVNFNDIENDTPDKDIDYNNVIKKSELLYSFSFIRGGTADCSELIRKYSRELIDSRIQDRAWSFFTNNNAEEADILPTSYATLALAANNFPEAGVGCLFLKNQIEEITKERFKDPETFAKVILALYVLIFSEKHSLKGDDRKKYKSILNKIWNSEYALMRNDTEQNVEYPYNTKHYYVRIPWQLYLMAISNELSYRYTSKVTYCDRLTSLIKQLANGGFKYLQSGKYTSSRTNAIAFDILDHLKEKERNTISVFILNMYDRFKNFLRKKWVKWIINIIGIAIAGYSILLYSQNNTQMLLDLAPELIGSLVIYLVLFNLKSEKN